MSTRPANSDGWHLVGSTVVRTSGFPIQLLDRMRLSRAPRLARAVARAEEALRRDLARGEDAGRPLPQRLARLGGSHNRTRRIIKRMARLAPLEAGDLELADRCLGELAPKIRSYHRRALVLQVLTAATGRVLRRELVEKLRELRALARDGRFREALFVANPAFFAAVERWLQRPPQLDRRSRRAARGLALYSQRFAAKNDTQSFFGPVFWAAMAPSRPGGVDIALEVPGRIDRCRARLAHWAAVALAQRMGADPELWRELWPHLRPRRFPLASVEGDRCRFVELLRDPVMARMEVPLDEADRALVRAVDGRRTAGAIVRGAARGLGDPAHLAGRLARLAENRVIVLGLEIPDGTPDSLGYLIRLLRRVPGRPASSWRGALCRLDGLVRAWGGAGLEVRRDALSLLEQAFSELTGLAPRRLCGRTYGDRMVVHEDCRRAAVRAVLGREAVEFLREEVLPAAGRALEPAVSLWRARRRYLQGWFESAFPGRAEVSLRQFVAAWRCDRPAAAEYARLAPGPEGDGGAAPTAPLAACIDLMLQVAPGGGVTRAVLAEVHALPESLTVSVLADFHPRPARLLREIVGHLRRAVPGAEPARLLGTHTNKVHAGANLPVTVIECPGRSVDPRLAARLEEVSVGVKDGELRLLHRSRPAYLISVPPGDMSLRGVLAALALPAPEGGHLRDPGTRPRRTGAGGRLVTGRAGWTLDARDLPRPGGRPFDPRVLLDWWRLKERLGLPDRVFARLPSEPKPLLLDFWNFFLADAVASLAKNGEGKVQLCEMLPDAPDLWLGDARGRYTCEFRILGFRYGKGSARQRRRLRWNPRGTA